MWILLLKRGRERRTHSRMAPGDVGMTAVRRRTHPLQTRCLSYLRGIQRNFGVRAVVLARRLAPLRISDNAARGQPRRIVEDCLAT